MVPEFIEGLEDRPLDTFLTMFEKLEDRCGGRVKQRGGRVSRRMSGSIETPLSFAGL
jgi:hypothetical protein